MVLSVFQVEHPAAKMMILGSQMQEQEVGDGTNFTIIFAGALLEHAENLIKMVCLDFCALPNLNYQSRCDSSFYFRV